MLKILNEIIKIILIKARVNPFNIFISERDYSANGIASQRIRPLLVLITHLLASSLALDGDGEGYIFFWAPFDRTLPITYNKYISKIVIIMDKTI
jgi:hypothetical protein